MRKGLLAAAIGVALVSPATADELDLPPAPAAAAPTSGLPGRGATMNSVESAFGEPSTRRPTVGGDSPKQPPITRWDYPTFSVIFEHDKVVDTVVPGAPAPVQDPAALMPGEREEVAEPVTPIDVAPDVAPDEQAELQEATGDDPPLPEEDGDVVGDLAEEPATEAVPEPESEFETEAEPEPAYEPEPEPAPHIPASSQIEKLPEAKFSTEDDPDSGE